MRKSGTSLPIQVWMTVCPSGMGRSPMCSPPCGSRDRYPVMATACPYGMIRTMNMVALWWLDGGGSDTASVAGQLVDLTWSEVAGDE